MRSSRFAILPSTCLTRASCESGIAGIVASSPGCAQVRTMGQAKPGTFPSEPEARWSLFDLATMEQELEDLFQRSVEEAALRNPFRRRAILSTKRTLYAA